MSTACILDGTFGQMFVQLQEIPLLVGCCFSAVVYMTRSTFIFFLLLYIFIFPYFIWPFQTYLNQTRSPYLCPIGSSVYQFPAIEMCYVSAVITMVICYTIFYRGRPGILMWIWLFLIFAIPAVVLCFFQFNVWYEVLMSAAISMAMTTVFMVHMFLFVTPCLPYLECVPPFSTFNYCDDMGWGNDVRNPNFYRDRTLLHRQLKYNADVYRLASEQDPSLVLP